MDLKDIQKLSDEELRFKVAEKCGWVFDNSICLWHLTTEDCDNQPPLPDYSKDLNAMHEAEKTLTDSQSIRFRCLLTQYGVDENFDPFFTGARKRAEIFIGVK